MTVTATPYVPAAFGVPRSFRRPPSRASRLAGPRPLVTAPEPPARGEWIAGVAGLVDGPRRRERAADDEGRIDRYLGGIGVDLVVGVVDSDRHRVGYPAFRSVVAADHAGLADGEAVEAGRGSRDRPVVVDAGSVERQRLRPEYGWPIVPGGRGSVSSTWSGGPMWTFGLPGSPSIAFAIS